MFVDHIKIYAKAGNGGDGSCSFRREKFVPKGGPDGGDGGRGGSIILRADPHIDTLTQFFYEPIIRAKSGENGRGKQCYGKSAQDKIVKVPIGTLIYRLPEGASPFAPKPQDWELAGSEAGEETEVVQSADEDEEEYLEDEEYTEEDEASEEEEDTYAVPASAADQQEHMEPAGATVGEHAAAKLNPEDLELVADLDYDGAELVLCQGGKGGKGNIHFKSSRNRVPRQFTPGEDGTEGYFLLELRSIAEAGFVGYPNAGKSTLLGKISSARPKVAPYPFTTLNPIIGIVDFDGYKRAPVADIPGLVEGASENVGLGHEFLRHIYRCRVLIFVIDMAGSEGRSPIDDLAQLRKEISLYDPTLSDRPWFVVANKMDDPSAEENLGHFNQRFPKLTVVPVSAELGEGVAEFKQVLYGYLFPQNAE
jgi:GTP-binding protein